MDGIGPTFGDRIVPVILAGGSGTRLWPLSRAGTPKQFQPLVGPFSSYQQALQRVADRDLFDPPIVVTGESFSAVARFQAIELGIQATLLLEPAGRDSAPAVAAAAAFVEARRPGAMLMALAADHIIFDEDAFRASVRLGRSAAASGRIVLFGLDPTEPKTSYGYIRPGERLSPDVLAVESFVEKPDPATAIRCVTDGNLWNSGNLLFRADSMISAFRDHAPDVLEAASAAVRLGRADIGCLTLDAASFASARRISIDYAVLEKASGTAVVRGCFRWSDIGTWDSIWQALPQDADGNAIRGNGLALDSRRCLVHSDNVLVAVAGVEDIVVVVLPDAVLVTARDDGRAVKLLADRIKAAGATGPESVRADEEPIGS